MLGTMRTVSWALVALVMGCQQPAQQPVNQPAAPVVAYQPSPQERSFGHLAYSTDAPPPAPPADPGLFAQRGDVTQPAPPPAPEAQPAQYVPEPAPYQAEEPVAAESVVSETYRRRFPRNVAGVYFGWSPSKLSSACGDHFGGSDTGPDIICKQLPEPLDFANYGALVSFRGGEAVGLCLETNHKDALERLIGKYGAPDNGFRNGKLVEYREGKWYEAVAWLLDGGHIILTLRDHRPVGLDHICNLTFTSDRKSDLEDHGF
jgi:hypothetical protein